MKLVIAIVNQTDANSVNNGIRKAGFRATKVSSTGSFLLSGNQTFFMGVPDERVEELLEIVKEKTKKRNVPLPQDFTYSEAGMISRPESVTVGGATVFVVDVEKYFQN